VILIMALAAVWITRLVARSKLGYSLLAIRENEDAAEAAGVDALGMKLRAMALSSFLTALGGTFYAQYFAYIDRRSRSAPRSRSRDCCRPSSAAPAPCSARSSAPSC
jgi:branched-chain amino acid transport system permease protein